MDENNGEMGTKNLHIAALFPHPEQDNSFWSNALRGMEKAAKEFGRMGVKISPIHFDRYSDSSFIDAWNEMTELNVDGLLLAPVLPDAGRDCLQSWPEEKPVVLFDTPLPGVKCLSFVGQVGAACGAMGAKLMTMGIKDPDKIAVIQIVPSDYHINQRVEGFLKPFQGNIPNLIKLRPKDLKEDSAAAFDKIISEYPDLEGLYITNAMVSSMAEEAQKRNKKLTIIGYDLTDESKNLMEEGEIDFLINQRPSRQAYKGLKLLWLHLAHDEEVPENIYMPIDIVSRETLEYYLE